jgi:hypothetical protein
VEGCTDSFEEDSNKKQEWELRKTSYIKTASERTSKHAAGLSGGQAV